MFEFQFEFQWVYLWLLLPLPAVFYWLKNTRSLAIHGIRFPMFTSLNQLADFSQKSFRLNTNQLLFWLAWLLLLSSVAKPVCIDESVELPIKGRDIILSIDLSKSISDYNRLGGIKKAAFEFVEQRKNDRIGLVVFGSSAYLYSPLTFDKNIIKDYLRTVQTRMAGDGTAIGDSIIAAVEHFQNSQQQGKPRALILLTDGDNTAGKVGVEEATQVAKQQNVKIYTIGLGGRGESALKYIANQTGGLYFHAKNTSALSQIYTKIDALEKNAEEKISYKVHKDLFFYPLSAFLLLLIVLMLRRR